MIMTRTALTDVGATHVKMDAHRHRAVSSQRPHKFVGYRRFLDYIDDDHLVDIQRPHWSEQSARILPELLVVRRVRSLGHHQLTMFQPHTDDRLLRMEAKQMGKRSPDVSSRGEREITAIRRSRRPGQRRHRQSLKRYDTIAASVMATVATKLPPCGQCDMSGPWPPPRLPSSRLGSVG